MSVGVGICTYNRPEFLRRATASVDKFLDGQLECKLVYDDGGTIYDDDLYQELSAGGWGVLRNEVNNGVAYSKNTLLKSMKERGCDHLIVMEDDIEVISSDAVSAYVGAMEATGIQHLNFAHHGPANAGKQPVHRTEHLELWGDVIGAWSVYTARIFDEIGYYDVEFRNELDHVHHTYMLSLNGYTTQWRAFADVVGSRELLAEQPGAIAASTIQHGDILDPGSGFQQSLRYWYQRYPMPADLVRLLR